MARPGVQLLEPSPDQPCGGVGAEAIRLARASLTNWGAAGLADASDAADIRILLARELARSDSIDEAITLRETTARSSDATPVLGMAAHPMGISDWID